MKSVFGIVLLAALTQAIPFAIKKGERHTFQYTSDVIHTLPGAARKQIGLRIHCTCHLDALTSRRHQIQLENIQIQQLEITDKEKPLPVTTIPEAVKELEYPFQVVFLPSGMISSVRAHPADPEWSLNIKRGMANLFQVSPKTFRKNPRKILTNKMPVIVNQREHTLIGLCPVTYTVVPEQLKNALIGKVTKTINYKQCAYRPEIKESIFYGKLCASCEKSLGYMPYLRQVGRIEHTFNKRLVEAKSQETHVITPFSEFAGQVHVIAKQHLILKSVQKSIAKPMLKFVRTGLTFKAVHPEYEQRQNTQYEQAIAMKVVRLLKQFKAIGDVAKPEVPRMVNDMISHLRLLKIPAIRKLMATVLKETSPKLRFILVDCFALAGSNEVTEVIKELAQKKQIPVDLLERILFNLPFTQKVSLVHLTAVKAICKLPQMKKPVHFSVRRQCYLSFGALVNRISQQPEAKQDVRIQMALTEITQALINRLKTTKDLNEKITLLKTIGNAGLRLCRKQVLAHLLDAKMPTHVRVESIWALRKIVRHDSIQIINILLEVFVYPRNAPELRMACIELLFDKVPAFHYMQVVVNTIKRELNSQGPRSNQVASWVISKLSYMAYYNNLIMKERAMNARLALRLLPYRSFGLSYSKAFRLATFSDKFQCGLELEMNKMNVPESYLPRNMNANMRVHLMGYTFNLAEFGGRIEGVQDIIQDVLSEVKSRQRRSVWDFIWSSFSSSSQESSVGSTEGSSVRPTTVHEQATNTAPTTSSPISGTELPTTGSMNVESQLQSQQPKVSMFMKLFGQELKYTEVTPKLVQQVADQVIQLLQGKKSQLQTPLGEMQITNNKIVIKQDITKAFLPLHARQLMPTLTGLPLHLHLMSSMVSDVVMDIQIEAKPSWWKVFNMESLKTKILLKPSISMTTIGKITVHNPFVRVGLEMNNNVQMRPHMNVEMTAEPRKKYTWKVENPSKKEEVLVISPDLTKPRDQGVCGIVEVQLVKTYTIMKQEVNMGISKQHLVQIKPYCFDEVFTGVKRCVEGEVLSLDALRLREVPVLTSLLMTQLRMHQTPVRDASRHWLTSWKVVKYTAKQMCVEATFSASGLKIKREIIASMTFNRQTRRLVIKTTQIKFPGVLPGYMAQITVDLTSLKSWDLEIMFGLKSDPYRIVWQGKILPAMRRIILISTWNKLPVGIHMFLQRYQPQLLYYIQTIASVSQSKLKQQQRMEIILELLSPLTAQLQARFNRRVIRSKVLALPLVVKRLPESSQDIADLMYGVCQVHKQRIELFDQQSIQLSQEKGHCLHVLAEDKGKQLFRVAVSFNKQQKQRLHIQIQTPQKVKITILPSLVVMVNGQACQQKVCEVKNVARIVKRGQRVKVLITSKYSLDVIYHPEKVQIRASPLLQDQVRGLCGDNNGEQYREFKSPTGSLLDTAAQFQKAWRVQC